MEFSWHLKCYVIKLLKQYVNGKRIFFSVFYYNHFLAFVPQGLGEMQENNTVQFKDWYFTVLGFGVNNDFKKIKLNNVIIIFFFSLQKILGLDSLEEVLDIKLVKSKFIMHNVYSVSKQGVVILDDKSSKCIETILFLVDPYVGCLIYRFVFDSSLNPK